MNLEKVIFGFFVMLAATLNFGFVVGEMDNISQHSPYALSAAVAINLVATILKFGDRTQLGAVHMATSLVADLQLVAACAVWVYSSNVASSGMTGSAMAQVVSLAIGALLANLVSVVLLVAETLTFQRR